MKLITTSTPTEEKPQLDSSQMIRVLSNTLGIHSLCCSFEGVSSRFSAYFRDQTFIVTYSDLENQLFTLSRERFTHMSVISASLEAFEQIHPLLVLAARSENQKEIGLLENEFSRIISSYPGIVLQYKWTVNACQFLNDLAVKWGLVTVHSFAHRFRLIPSTILSECSRLTELCFLPDLLYFAAVPRKDASLQTKDLCIRVKVMLMQLLEILLTLNTDIDFTQTHEVTDFLFSGGRVVPEVAVKRKEISIEEKRAVATRLNLHLLALPPWWKCECLYSEEDRRNKLLKSFLKYFCKEYCELEAAAALPTACNSS